MGSMTLDIAALYASEHERLCGYFRRRLGKRDPSIADDLAAAVFLRAWDRRDRYRPLPGVPPAAWLMAIARNILTDHFRSEHPTVSLDARVAMGLEPITTDRADQIDRTLALSVALDALPEKQRAVIVGRFYERQKVRDLMHISTYHGVKKLQDRALVNLRRALEVA